MRRSTSAGLPASDVRGDKMERTRACIGIGALVAVALVAAACSSTPAAPKPGPKPTTETFPGAAAPSGSWPYPNADLANTRIAPGSVISSANVGKLQEAWTFELAGKAAAGVEGAGSFAANPVVVNGVVYI